MDYRNSQKETAKRGYTKSDSLDLQLIHDGTCEMNHDQQSSKGLEGHRLNSLILHIAEVRQNEVKGFQGDLPTSLQGVEMDLAQCISQCLHDLPLQKRNTSVVLNLLRQYKVLIPLSDQKRMSISLAKLEILIQDNYRDSFLGELFAFMLGCKDKVEPKSILF